MSLTLDRGVTDVGHRCHRLWIGVSPTLDKYVADFEFINVSPTLDIGALDRGVIDFR